jgi:hypothetical protein
MYSLEVYIQNERLDLFKDETVSLNSSVQNIKDISKVFSDFTKSFTVPTSKKNNKIFKRQLKLRNKTRTETEKNEETK